MVTTTKDLTDRQNEHKIETYYLNQRTKDNYNQAANVNGAANSYRHSSTNREKTLRHQGNSTAEDAGDYLDDRSNIVAAAATATAPLTVDTTAV